MTKRWLKILEKDGELCEEYKNYGLRCSKNILK